MSYFPNATAADVLERQCADCPLGYGWNDPKQKRLFDPDASPLPCPTAFVQLQFNYEQCDNPQLREAMTALVDDEGVCQTRKLLMQIRKDGE